MEKTTKTTKITKADRFTALSDFLTANPGLTFATPKGDISAEDMGKFVQHEIELLAKKNTSDKKPTAQQEANEAIKAGIIATMEADPNRIWTITELLKAVPDLPDTMTNQRMSALVRQMVDVGKVERTVDKRKAFFSLA